MTDADILAEVTDAEITALQARRERLRSSPSTSDRWRARRSRSLQSVNDAVAQWVAETRVELEDLNNA